MTLGRERDEKMTTTVERPAQDAAPPARGRWGRNGSGGEPDRRVPTPPRLRRRWGVFAAMAAVVCLGALGNVWLHQATTNASPVVAARSTIARGQIINRADLVTVQIGVDPALHPVPASQLETLVGKRAALDIAAGSLLTGDEVTDKVIPARGKSVVGVAVPATLLPGIPLVAGDQIRVVATPGAQGEATPGAPPSIAASVVSAATSTDNGQGSLTIITVSVPDSDAAGLAAMAATGKIAIVLDSRER